MSEDTRLCRHCRTQRPVSQFEERFRCSPCAQKGAGDIAVRVDLKGWEVNLPGLPEMRVPTPAEVEEGYRGVLWRASKTTWNLDVVWRGDLGRYLCRAVRLEEPDDPAESRVFDYPHEVVDWISVWVAHLDKVR